MMGTYDIFLLKMVKSRMRKNEKKSNFDKDFYVWARMNFICLDSEFYVFSKNIGDIESFLVDESASK